MREVSYKFLKTFARDYFQTALDIVVSEISLSDFDHRVRAIVGHRFGMTKSQMKHVHHLFHKVLFLEDYEGSPLEESRINQ